MYARRGLGAVPPGSVALAFSQSMMATGGNPMQGPDVVSRLIAAIQQAMTSEDVPSVLGLASSLLPFTDEGPNESVARQQGYGPGQVDQVYRTAQLWVSSRPTQFNQQLGPGYSTAIVTGPDTNLTADQASQQVDAQRTAYQQQQNAGVINYVANGLIGHGWSGPVVTAEIARLDKLFAGKWPDPETAWNAIDPRYKEFTAGFTPSGGPGPLIPGQQATPDNVVTYPDGTKVSVSSGGTVRLPPSDSDATAFAPEGPGMAEAGFGGFGMLLLAGVVVGGIVMSKNKARR